MTLLCRFVPACAICLVCSALVAAQGEKQVAGGAIAATVNGQPIPASVLDRATKNFPAEKQAEARAEILDYLIDNALVEQYLVQQKITVDEKEVEARMTEIKNELTKNRQTIAGVLQTFKMTEAEFRAQVTADLRWEKFAQAQATDAALKALFDQAHDIFDGSRVRARHILISASAKDSKALETAKAETLKIRRQIELAAARLLEKLPAASDALTREKARVRALEDAFIAAAREKSACPSKRDGGDLNWFPRAGSMVEAFAKAAFDLKPFELSQPVLTQFGYHLILVTDLQAGQPVKFEDVREEVREVFVNRLRESLCIQLRPSANIVLSRGKP